MKVACIQLSSGEDYTKNFKDIIKYVNQAIKNQADLIITPETSSLMSADKKNLFKIIFQILGFEHFYFWFVWISKINIIYFF